MVTATNPGDDRPSTPQRKLSPLAAALAIVALFGGSIGVVAFSGEKSSTRVLPPTDDERAQTVPLLAQAAASQGICYGWRLERASGSVVNAGSNFGDGVAVQSAGCSRWVQVRAKIDYGTKIRDHATVTVVGSSGIGLSERDEMEQGLKRFGLDEGTFLDEPGWAICRAAVMLPLLAAEAGLAPPAVPPGAVPPSADPALPPSADPALPPSADPALPPSADPALPPSAVPAVPPSAAPAAAVAPLPDAGSDFWRAHRGWLLTTAVMLMAAGLLIAVGFVLRGHPQASPGGRTQDKG